MINPSLPDSTPSAVSSAIDHASSAADMVGEAISDIDLPTVATAVADSGLRSVTQFAQRRARLILTIGLVALVVVAVAKLLRSGDEPKRK